MLHLCMKINARDAQDIPWREASRVLSRLPHRAIRMQSLNSVPPLRNFICPRCLVTEYSTTTLAPQCYGGLVNRNDEQRY